MDGDFEFEKERLNKIFYGLDATKSYTKKDTRTLTGDIDLRRQVKLPKSALGYCTPLSLEINGTIFSGDKLRFDKLASIKKFASVFSKRVALTAQPNPCQNCECTADNNGVTRMECIPCIYPTPISVDYVSFFFSNHLFFYYFYISRYIFDSHVFSFFFFLGNVQSQRFVGIFTTIEYRLRSNRYR